MQGEASDTPGNSHYMRGGKPGEYPKWSGFLLPPLQLYDPFNLSSKRSAEQKANGLLVEINNGRLAMIGIMSFLAEAKIKGSVPALEAMAGTASEVKPYAGNLMAPFDASFHLFPDSYISGV